MYIRKKNEKAFIFLKNSGDSAANSIKIISCGVNSAIESLQALRNMFAEKLFKLICGMPKKSAAVIGEYAFRRECGNCRRQNKESAAAGASLSAPPIDSPENIFSPRAFRIYPAAPPAALAAPLAALAAPLAAAPLAVAPLAAAPAPDPAAPTPPGCPSPPTCPPTASPG